MQRAVSTVDGVDTRFKVGTLVYTRSGLIVLFGWLLWGDFVYTLMERAMPALLPLVLRDAGADNKMIAFVSSSVVMGINAIACPIISYKSDRHRGRWGRRKPFILVTTPFVVLFLALIPFGPGMAGWFTTWLPWLSPQAVPTVSVIIGFTAILVACFQIFDAFVSSTYYYLIADVVPEAFIARFYALFRVFGTLASLLFNYFILGLAEGHMREVFVGISILYGVVITVMCLRVREGEYPPVPVEPGRPWWHGPRDYMVLCFGSPFYLLVFAAYSLAIWANLSNVFTVFLAREQLHLSLDQYGKIMALASVVGIVAMYPIGSLIDRLGSHRSLLLGFALSMVVRTGAYFLVGDFLSMAVWVSLLGLPTGLIALSLAKWLIDLYPKEHYGQFGSAGAMISSIGAALLAPACGVFFDYIENYRWVFLWAIPFQFIALFLVYSVWRRRAV